MRRQPWLNLILLAVVTLLALAVWLTPDETAPTDSLKLTLMQPQQIDSIEIINRSGKVELQRTQNGWQMSAPYTITANAVRIEQLLQIATAESLQRFPSPTEQLAEFGLAEPQAIIKLGQQSIQMGNTNPVSHQRYLRSGDTIHLIKDRFPHHLMAAATEFIALELVPPNSQLEAIHTPDWSISKGEKGKLQLEPAQTKLSMDDLNRKITQWQQAQASSITALQQAEPIGEIKLILKDRSAPLSFKLVKSAAQTLLWRPELGLAYHLPTATALLTPPASSETP